MRGVLAPVTEDLEEPALLALAAFSANRFCLDAEGAIFLYVKENFSVEKKNEKIEEREPRYF